MYRYFHLSTFFKKKSVSLLAVGFFLIVFFYMGKQNVAVAQGLNTFSLVMTPEFPEANEVVEVKLSSPSFDVRSSELTVTLDGTVVRRGVGIEEFSFKTGDIGERNLLHISFKKQDGDVSEKEFVVIPAEVDLIYELNDPFVPRGYQGKSTVLSNSHLTVYAFPTLTNQEGAVYEKESLIYTWSKNLDTDFKQSGFGKASYTIESLDAFPRNTAIGLKVSTLDGDVVAQKSIFFSPQHAEVEFYLLDSTTPFAFKNIANPNLYSESLDITVKAVPYFMENLSGETSEYSWLINNKRFTHGDSFDKNMMVISNDSERFLQQATISLEIIQRGRILQSLRRKEVTVDFKDPSENIEEGRFFTQGKFVEEPGFFDSF